MAEKRTLDDEPDEDGLEHQADGRSGPDAAAAVTR